jgi:hypothetical protein
MSDLRSDMFDLGRICSITRNFEQRKSRSGVKTMHLGPNKLTISKLENIELKEITGETRSNLKFRNQT